MSQSKASENPHHMVTIPMCSYEYALTIALHLKFIIRNQNIAMLQGSTIR